MKKVDLIFKNNLISSCDDMLYKNNGNNLRERYVFVVDGSYKCVEGNTNGWYLEGAISSFSGSVQWLNNC